MHRERILAALDRRRSRWRRRRRLGIALAARAPLHRQRLGERALARSAARPGFITTSVAGSTPTVLDAHDALTTPRISRSSHHPPGVAARSGKLPATAAVGA